jgi:hypothetical protein
MMYSSLYRIFMKGNFRLHNNLCKIERYCSLNIQVDDAKGDMVPATKKRAKRSNKTEAAVKEIMTHLKSSNIPQHILIDIPSRFISKNWFPPESLYLINPDVAGMPIIYFLLSMQGNQLTFRFYDIQIFVSVLAEVGKTIKNYLLKNNDTVPVFEMNPGLGLITQELINAGVVNLNVFEPSISFHQRLLVRVSFIKDFKICNINLVITLWTFMISTTYNIIYGLFMLQFKEALMFKK